MRNPMMAMIQPAMSRRRKVKNEREVQENAMTMMKCGSREKTVGDVDFLMWITSALTQGSLWYVLTLRASASWDILLAFVLT